MKWLEVKKSKKGFYISDINGSRVSDYCSTEGEAILLRSEIRWKEKKGYEKSFVLVQSGLIHSKNQE